MGFRKIFNGHSRGPKPSRWKEQSQGSFESFFERLKGPQMLPADVEMEVEEEHSTGSACIAGSSAATADRNRCKWRLCRARV